MSVLITSAVSGCIAAQSHRKILGIAAPHFASLAILYGLAHGGLLTILNAVYWDDWTLYNVDPAAILGVFDMMGSVLNQTGYLHVAMLAVGPWFYKVLTFVLMFASGLFLWKILERHKWVDPDTRYVVVLLFLVLPLYSARLVLIDFPYTLRYFLFFLAWFLLGRQRVLALVLFFVSFNTNSMLVFYAVPIIEWYVRDEGTLDRRRAANWVLRRLDFMALPFVFWFIKKAFFRPFGIFSGYNETFGIEHLVRAPVVMAKDFLKIEISIALLLVALVVVVRCMRSTRCTPGSADTRFLTAGVIALLCAVFPYWIVGAVPTFLEWSSRHQLLMPLGTALVIAWMFGRMSNLGGHAALVFIVALSIALNVQVYMEYFRDWRKQEEVIAFMAANDHIRDATLVVFDDRTPNARGRLYRFYEWNGLMRIAYGDQRRFGLARQGIQYYREGRLDDFFLETTNSRHHVRRESEQFVVVKIDRAAKSASLYDRMMGILRGNPDYAFSVYGPCALTSSTSPACGF